MSSSVLIAEESVSQAERERLESFRCRGCGECCFLRIPLTHTDVTRITTATGLSAAELVELVPATEFRGGHEHLEWIWFGPRRRQRRVMCLKESDGHCMYLADDNRCSAYEYRPTVCRIHPFVLGTCARGERIESVEVNNGCECAGSLDGENCLDELLELHVTSDDEDRSYKSLVASWNRSRRERSEATFLDFVGLGD
jgi:Fe-S-cluster containining protein